MHLAAADFAMNPRPPTRSALLQMYRAFLLSAACIFSALGPAVSYAESPTPAASQAERVYTVRGVIRSPFRDGKISIKHEAIPDYMPAMTMPFNVTEADVKELKAGDRVEFQFHVSETSRATHFRKLPADPSVNRGSESSVTLEKPAKASSPAAGTRRLRDGDVVPAFTLRDQNDRTVTEKDLAGRFTVAAFVFTRCPVPEFCPLVAKKFQALQAALSDKHDEATRLLSITIDPEYDQPAILRAYGEALGADFNRWRFATGTPAEIERLRKMFAVHAERTETSLDHTLATALIGPDGKLVTVFRGNAWKPDDVLAQIGP
jgi:protein SCO1